LRDFAQPREAFPIAGPDEDLEAVLSRVGPALERGVLVMEGHELVGILSSLEVARIAARRQMLGPRPRVAA
jgi:predicted transcriptional regulator